REKCALVETWHLLVLSMDKWFASPVLGEAFDPMGLPNTGSRDYPWPSLDYDLKPSLAEAVAARADRATKFRDFLGSVEAVGLTRPVEVLENGTNPLLECIYTVFEEEFWHNRYARRDLAELSAATEPTKRSDRAAIHVGCAADGRAQLGVERSEVALAVVPTGNDPGVQHPEVSAGNVGATASCGARRLFALDPTTDHAQTAMLMPVIVGSGESDGHRG